MSISSDFDDTVKICEFYSGDDLPIKADYDNYSINLGGYVVDLVMADDHLARYLVVDPDHKALFVSDLDAYFQERLPEWEDRF